MSMLTYLRKTLVQNILALYGVQAFGYLLPLIIVPFLTRTLGPEGWGSYAFFQSFAMYAASIIEYSFSMWGTREISRARDNRAKKSDLFYGVIGAKTLMSGFIIIVGAMLCLFVPAFRSDPVLFGSSLLWAVTLGFSFLWFFQGMERMKLVAGIDICSRAGATLLIFLLIRKPEQIALVFLLYTGANVVSLAVSYAIAIRDVAGHVPSFSSVWSTLRAGFPLFQINLASNLYSIGNVFILGLFATPVAVGIYAGASKIVRAAMVMLFDPLNRVIFPRQSYLIGNDPAKARRLFRLGFIALTLGGTVIAVLFIVFAPFIVRLVLGEGFEKAVNIVRILAVMAPVVAVSSVLGNQWMLPHGHDRLFSAVIWGAAVVDALAIILLVPRMQETGMALASVAVECFVCLLFIILLASKGLLSPLWRKERPIASADEGV